LHCFILNLLLNLVHSGDGIAQSRNMLLFVHYNKYNGVRRSVEQQYLLTCIYSRKGPLCNEMFPVVSHIVHGSALPSENLTHSRESVSRPTDGKVWLKLIGWNLTAWYPTQSAISPFFFFFLLFSRGAWNGRNGCTNGDLYTSGKHSFLQAVGIGVSFIGHKLARGWISRVLFSAEAKRLKMCPLYVSILRNTENITLSFNSLSNCGVILLETQKILEDLLRNYHCQWILC
jgi:hypothetical protein